jgi:hypothetical protein
MHAILFAKHGESVNAPIIPVLQVLYFVHFCCAWIHLQMFYYGNVATKCLKDTTFHLDEHCTIKILGSQ